MFALRHNAELSSCWGCHQSLLNAHLGLLPILPALDIVYWPAVVDFKHESLIERPDGDIKVGFIEGMIRTKEDKENVLLMRKKCAVIIAFGACACYGSVAGLANLWDKEELVRRKFMDAESITNKDSAKEPTENVPGFEDYVVNVDDLIDVDIFIPGCPPRTENIIAAIAYLLTVVGEGPDTLNKNSNVCETCSLSSNGCFLDNGKLCFGAITAAGCKEMCPNNGEPCLGCFKVTSKLGDKARQLKEIIDNVLALTPEQGSILQHFLDLYLGVANITNFYFRGDLLQRLAYEPESFSTKEINGKLVVDVAPTGETMIDEIVGRALHLLKGDSSFKFSSKTVCSHCEREVADKVPTTLKRDYEGLSNTEQCFLEQGYICLGPVTQAGCGTICPNKANAPCLGCYGPPVGIKEQGAKMIGALGSLCQDRPLDEVMNMVKDPAGLFNRFTLAASTLGHKYHDNFKEE
ncbi:MAG: hypothetical protein ACTSR8_16155 [Promethearchaeota archaeon]